MLDRTVRVGDDQWRIVGVLPTGFRFPGQTDLWIPRATLSTSRTRHNVFAVGRLEPGVSLEQSQSELDTIAARLERQYPDSNTGRGVSATRLQDGLVSDVRLTLYLLWGVVGMVLLIACANTATLLLGRATGRTREIAVRAALGASRRRIVRQLFTESLLLALVAGAAGTLLAHWAQPVLVALRPADVVRLADTGIDGGVLVFTLTVSIATSGLFGLVPALHASRIDLIDAAKPHSLMAGRTVRTRGVLVVSQVALAVVLLTGAGLLIKSLVALQRVVLGFRPENVLVMKATGVGTAQENNAFFGSVLSRVAALPGVAAVGATSTPPGDLSNSGSGPFFIDRIPAHRDRTIEPQALFTVVAPQTFTALAIPLKSGRDFEEGDIEGRPLVAIVNEALVQDALAGENPIGRTIFCAFDRPQEGMTIIGVVGDVRQRNPAVDPQPECYMPYTQHAYNNNNTLHVVARTLGDPTALAETVRREAPGFDPFLIQSDADVVSSAYDVPLHFAPGEQWQYCNVGYFALAEIIRTVSGRPWSEFLTERVFAPSGMRATRTTTTTERDANRAVGYTDNDRLLEAVDWPAVRPSGAFLSTVLDLAKWDAVLDSDDILTGATRRRMWTPVALNDGTIHPYGLGWELDPFHSAGRALRRVHHGGGMPGFRTEFMRLVDERLTIVVLMNLDDADARAIAFGVANILLRTPESPRPRDPRR